MTTGLVTPNSGKIFLNDVDITNFPFTNVLKAVSVTWRKEASVFRKMVEDNIKSVLEMTKFSRAYQKEKLETLISEFNLQAVRHNIGDVFRGRTPTD